MELGAFYLVQTSDPLSTDRSIHISLHSSEGWCLHSSNPQVTSTVTDASECLQTGVYLVEIADFTA